MKTLFRKLLTISGILVLLMTKVQSAASEQTQTPTADFTGTPTSGLTPLMVQFTDQSNGDPSGWAWYFGDEELSTPWAEATASAEWEARQNHTSVVLPDGNIVLMGGFEGNLSKNDVWCSTDGGATWTELIDSAPWSPRSLHTSVVLPDGSIVLMGGWRSVFFSTVWRSEDGGENWNLETNDPGWSARYGHTSVVLPNGNIVLMGGKDENGPKNDVWRSTDGGATWTELTDSAPWSARYEHTSVVLPDGRIVLMGGEGGYDKVWRSDDGGKNWTQLTNKTGWGVRDGHTSVVLPDGSIVLMGGRERNRMNDVWRSTDGGANWTELTDSAAWSTRTGHTSVVLPDGRIVLMGGNDDFASYVNDVWQLETAGSNLQNPKHNFTEPGTYTVTIQVFNAEGVDRISKPGYIKVIEQSQAEFTGTPTSGQAPLQVDFINQSTGDFDACEWDFGDGGTSSDCFDPSHTYQTEDTFTVALMISGPGGEDTEIKVDYIHVGMTIDLNYYIPLILR